MRLFRFRYVAGQRLLPLLFAGLWLGAASDCGTQHAVAVEKEVAAAAGAEGAPAVWPQWRGPDRDGQLRGVPAWPERLDDNCLTKLWRTPLEPSYSGPIVAADRIFVTETRDKKVEVVKALDRATGKLLWETTWEGALSVPFFAKSNGDWIRATPAFDGETLYVAGMRDLLVAIDAASGKIRWKVDFTQEFAAPVPAFGFVSSPLVDGAFVYVQAGASCVKLEKATGKVLWRALKDAGGMWGSAFSSPYLAELAGRRQLLVQTREKLAGVDPESGAELWSREIPAFRGMNILTPTVLGDSIFTSTYGGKTLLISVKKEGEALKADEAWTNKATGYMSTPVVIDGHAYLHLQNQRFTCIELASGQTKWTTPPFGKYWSMVANGSQILALDERGDLLLIRANPEKFDRIGSVKVSDDSWAHVAVCGDEIYVRELNGLMKFRWSK